MTENKNRRIDCPLTDFTDAYVELPEYWLGKHCVRRDEAIIASKEYGNVEITNFSISLFLLEDFENIPGIEGKDTKKWKLDETPLLIISWLSEVVMDDFSLAYKVPKNS